MYCTAPTDNIVLRVTGGGEHLYETFPCGDLLESLPGAEPADENDPYPTWTAKMLESKTLKLGDPDEEMTGAREERTRDSLMQPVMGAPDMPAASIKWWFDTFTKSNVPRCYTGDAFPFEVPTCNLLKDNVIVASRPHGLADLYLHNDVLNSAISGFPTHESMPAIEGCGALDTDFWSGTNCNLQPSTNPTNLDTWYDFDAFQA